MVTFDSGVTIKRPPEEVFAFVAEPMNEPEWHQDVVEVKRTSDGSIGAGSTFELKMKFMGTHQVQFEVKEFVPGRREVMTAVSRGPLMPISQTPSSRSRKGPGSSGMLISGSAGS